MDKNELIPESAIFFGRIKNRKIFVLGNIKVIFRPPFINGRPQDSDSVFGKGISPIF